MNFSVNEFVYKLPGLTVGTRPGAHRSNSRGSGMSFAAHARLFDQPDPRRLDLRASMQNLSGDWLVRSYLQRSSITIKVIVDVSDSMRFGTPGKLQIAADFLQALGNSAHAYGDSVSLLAYDHRFREDLFLPASTGRATGTTMASAVLDSATSGNRKNTSNALDEAIACITGTTGLVFIVSDFHGALDTLSHNLDNLSTAKVVPLVIWDQAEIIPPSAGQWLAATGIKSGQKRQLWVREKTRKQWLNNVKHRRKQINAVFDKHDSIPVYFESHFDAEVLSRYFMEKLA